MPQNNESPHSGTTIPAMDWSDPAELTLRLKYGPGGRRVIKKRFELKHGPDRPDHHGVQNSRRDFAKDTELAELHRLENASDEQLASITIYDSLVVEPVDDSPTELFED